MNINEPCWATIIYYDRRQHIYIYIQIWLTIYWFIYFASLPPTSACQLFQLLLPHPGLERCLKWRLFVLRSGSGISNECRFPNRETFRSETCLKLNMNFAIPFCHQLNQSAMTAFCWKAVAVDRSRRRKGMTGRIWHKKAWRARVYSLTFPGCCCMMRMILHINIWFCRVYFWSSNLYRDLCDVHLDALGNFGPSRSTWLTAIRLSIIFPSPARQPDKKEPPHITKLATSLRWHATWRCQRKNEFCCDAWWMWCILPFEVVGEQRVSNISLSPILAPMFGLSSQNHPKATYATWSVVSRGSPFKESMNPWIGSRGNI